ncbi:MAG: DUF1028 domain-containing protein [Solirubrobacterales bacterium]
MTYSLLARDPGTGEIGVAVQSHFFGVGRLIPWGRAGVGVVATQSFVEASYGPTGLSLMAEGVSPREALDRMVSVDPDAAVRQVALMDITGIAAVHTGADCIGDAADAAAPDVCAQSNLCASPAIPGAMVEAFHEARGSLAPRMLAALRAAESLGGDIRGRQSVAMLVVRIVPTGSYGDDRPVDLRVDDAPAPLDELERLLRVGGAFAGLLRMLATEGLFSGDPAAAPAGAVEDAVAELEEAQRAIGTGNLEPTVWRGLLLARAGHGDEARDAFARAATGDPRVAGFVRRLAAAGMWPGDPATLERLLPPDPEAT